MNTLKFKKGDWIKSKNHGRIARVVMLLETCYSLVMDDGDCWTLDYGNQDNWELTDAPLEDEQYKAAKEYSDQQEAVDYPDYFCRKDIEEAFKAGAKWQEEKDEARIKQAHDWGFGAGSEWQKAQDTRDMFMSDNRHFNKVYELGKKDMKEQMMKEAVEGAVCATITETNAISFLSPLPKELTAGDKVRIVILKVEEK